LTIVGILVRVELIIRKGEPTTMAY